MSERKKVLFDSRWISNHGIGRVSAEYRNRLRDDFSLIEIDGGPKPSKPTDFLFLARQFKRAKAHVLITPGYNGTPFVRQQIFFVHDLIHLHPQEPNGKLKRIYLNNVVRQAARRSSVVTVSETSANLLREVWPECARNVTVIKNGVSSAFGQTSAHEGQRRGVILFGNNRWHKNMPRVLAAISKWQGRGLDSEQPVTIIGSNDGLVQRCEAAGVKNLRNSSNVTDLELAALYRRSAALLFCSIDEGFGLPVIEAIAERCPVVLSDIPVHREIGEGIGVFVDPLSVDSIAAGISEAVGQAVSASDAVGIKQQYDWDIGYASLRNLITSRTNILK